VLRLIALSNASICLGQSDARGNRHDVALALSFAGTALRCVLKDEDKDYGAEAI
jgi:hypothetical protein